MEYLVVDAGLGGDGIRRRYESYIDIEELNLSPELHEQIENWVRRYQEAFMSGFSDVSEAHQLDKEGLEIAKSVKAEVGECKMQYFSDYTLQLTYFVE